MMEQKRMGIRTLRRSWDLCNTVEFHRIMNSFTFPSIYVFSIRSQLSLSFSRFPPWESTKWNPIAHSFVRNHLSNRRLIRALSMKIFQEQIGVFRYATNWGGARGWNTTGQGTRGVAPKRRREPDCFDDCYGNQCHSKALCMVTLQKPTEKRRENSQAKDWGNKNWGWRMND